MSAGLSQHIRDNTGLPSSPPNGKTLGDALAQLEDAFTKAWMVERTSNPLPTYFKQLVLEKVKDMPANLAIANLEDAAEVLLAWAESTPNERRNARWPGGFDLRKTRAENERVAKESFARTQMTVAAGFNAEAFIGEARRAGWVIELAAGGANLRVVEPQGRAVPPVFRESTLRNCVTYKAKLVDALWTEASRPGVTSAGERVI
jgi:hypothetical protein